MTFTTLSQFFLVLVFALVLAMLCVPIQVNGQPNDSGISCNWDAYIAETNYTNPFIWDAINSMGNLRPAVLGSPWLVDASYLWTTKYNGVPTSLQNFFVWNETSIRGGNGSQVPLYNIILAGDMNNINGAQVFVHDQAGNCLVNGYPYRAPMVDYTLDVDAYCDFFDMLGDYSANAFECYTRSSGSLANNDSLNNIPTHYLTRDQKYSIYSLPECTPIHNVLTWINTTSNTYRVIQELYFNVQYPNWLTPWVPLEVYSTCSNFPGPHPFDASQNAARNYYKGPSVAPPAALKKRLNPFAKRLPVSGTTKAYKQHARQHFVY